MPRASKAQAERNRAEIERVSSLLIRQRGLGVSLADVMGAAGLTHGGFYKHFESKDEMAAAACSNAFAEAAEDWEKISSGAIDPAHARAALIEHYLRPSSDPSEPGCPMAVLAMDVYRSGENNPVKESFRDGFEKLASVFSKQHTPISDAAVRRELALAEISAMVGALVLSRATGDGDLSQEILAAARKSLLGADA